MYSGFVEVSIHKIVVVYFIRLSIVKFLYIYLLVFGARRLFFRS